MAKQQKRTETIYFGKDLTSIDEAWVLKPNASKPECVNAADKEKLWKFLLECNNKIGDKDNDLIIVAHSEGKKAIDEKRKYSLTSIYTPRKDNDSAEENEIKPNTQSEKDNQDDADSKIEKETSSEKDYRKFGQLVGTIRGNYGKQLIKVIIFSRFDSVNFNDVAKSKPYFLASLLLKGKLRFSQNADVDFNHESLFDFYMIWIMKQHFEEAMLKGFFKKYQRFERNDDRLRGSIDIARHIRLNMGMDMGRVAYSYRENSTDNMVNHLILSAYDYLEEKYPQLVADNFDNEFEMQIRNLKYEIGYPKYDRRTIINKNAVPISHPFFLEYKHLQEDCLKILRDEGVSPFESKDESISGILYYVPDLWEEYLEDYITEALRRKNGEVTLYEEEKALSVHMKAQKEIKVMVGMENERKDIEEANEKSGGHSTYPDYVFSYSEADSGKEHCFFVLDAKYRYYWPNALNGILDSEVLGDYDKCIRDMESIGGTGTGVMFPVRKEELENLGKQYRHRFSVYNNFKCFYTLPVEVPDTVIENETDNSKKKQTSFPEWDWMMRTNMNKVMNYLANMLQFEACRKKELIQAEIKINKKLKELESSMVWDSFSIEEDE